jgi:putative FmdB family regulatory protein
MPVYEYECQQCGELNAFVEELGSGRIVARRCRKCGARKLRKVISKTVYHPEVTLEDLGINVVRRPAAQMPQAPQPQGPPGGKCPYCDAAAENDSGEPEK